MSVSEDPEGGDRLLFDELLAKHAEMLEQLCRRGIEPIGASGLVRPAVAAGPARGLRLGVERDRLAAAACAERAANRHLSRIGRISSNILIHASCGASRNVG
jgi:hypothetical protein